MSIVEVRAALESRLDAIIPAIDTAWENVSYTPVYGREYQKVNFLWGEPENPVMGGGYREKGIMQVTLFYPDKKGPADAAARANLIRSAFPRALSLTNGGVVVTIDRTPQVAMAEQDGDRYKLPIRITFYSNML